MVRLAVGVFVGTVGLTVGARVADGFGVPVGIADGVGDSVKVGWDVSVGAAKGVGVG